MCGFKPILVSGVTCPKCEKSDNIHPHGSKYGRKYFKCYGCQFIFVDPAERERPVRNLAEKLSHAEANHLWYLKNRDRIIKQKMENYVPHPRISNPTARKIKMTMTTREPESEKSFVRPNKPTCPNDSSSPIIPIKKPLSTVESIEDIPCFLNCAHSFAECDPTKCVLLDEFLGLYRFPLMVVSK